MKHVQGKTFHGWAFKHASGRLGCNAMSWKPKAKTLNGILGTPGKWVRVKFSEVKK